MPLIRNLVQEFNGLVSKGSAEMLAFLLFKNSAFYQLRFAEYSTQFSSSLYLSLHPYQKNSSGLFTYSLIHLFTHSPLPYG